MLLVNFTLQRPSYAFAQSPHMTSFSKGTKPLPEREVEHLEQLKQSGCQALSSYVTNFSPPKPDKGIQTNRLKHFYNQNRSSVLEVF